MLAQWRRGRIAFVVREASRWFSEDKAKIGGWGSKEKAGAAEFDADLWEDLAAEAASYKLLLNDHQRRVGITVSVVEADQFSRVDDVG
jgi:hypothetical protein